MAALVVLVAVVAVYLQSLGGEFLWDDYAVVLDAPLVERGGSLGDFLNAPFWSAGAFHGESSSYYRPLVTLSLALDGALHGKNAAGYHLTNVLLHATNALLVLALLRKQGTRAGPAALLAVGWALLPRLAEAAAWISGRTDVLAALFTFAALLAWGPSVPRRVAAALLLGVGLLGKEVALAGAFALVTNAWFDVRSEPKEQRFRRLLVQCAPLAIVLAGYAVLRVQAVGFAKNETTALGALGRARTIVEAVGTYAAMLVDAWRPRAVIGRVGAPSISAFVAGAAVIALLAPLARFRGRLRAESRTGLALFFGSLVLVLHVVPLPLLTLAADRFLYLPTAGLALALAPALDRFLALRRGRWAGALAVVASLAVATTGRVGAWSNELDFWVQTYLETPKTNNAAATELASVYYRAGLYEDAWILSERALRYDDPRRTTATYNAGLCLARLGRLDAARARLESLRGKRHAARDVDVRLALIEARSGNHERAARLLAPIAASDPFAAELAKGLGEFTRARRELAALGDSGPAAQRASLATLLDDEPTATRAWLEVLEAPNAAPALAAKAIDHLLRQGDRALLERAAAAYRRRFGTLEPGLSAMIDVQLADLGRLAGARSRLALGGRERTREIAEYAR
jgi:protein O-mannosyl-transferase